MRLQGFDISGFLRDHWQRRPLLIRNPWTHWENPIDPGELAGLACEPDVESRLITETGDKWKVEHGPIDERRFRRLGERQWTLLVQAVDHHVPEVASLIAPFRFIPNWRIDDVMVSCAADGGGVGPHFDHYDVFLIQGLGKRRWRVGTSSEPGAATLPHDDLRLLADFEPGEEWVLEPGDILYVPPGFGHEGVAVGDDCMTYSIGFRAPSRGELISHWSDHLIDQFAEDDRYTDPDLAAQENPGEIPAHAIATLHEMVTEKMLDRDAFARWFGLHSSSPKYAELDWRPEMPTTMTAMRLHLAARPILRRNPASRFSFVRQGAEQVLLFVDGQCFECASETRTFAELVCAQDIVTVTPKLIDSDAVMDLAATLYNQGSLGLDEQSEGAHA
ncbi:cupin domain-containing protein [Sphingosinicella rhizophila]|uniref:Cupin domain-containing protein n=1 Tax=Sphingosinicella rhizophila TaxID=3050082 RepID=A0ABU3Q876_9SPHN|nr:cupin domain-containing protein [Sphingosinicella sp. GR2756]MDT9599299.1 cupin domain-containing protein [Sphingosinicella sp. GR2756]